MFVHHHTSSTREFTQHTNSASSSTRVFAGVNVASPSELERSISLRWSWTPPFLFPEGVVTSSRAGETFTSSPEHTPGGERRRRACCSIYPLEGATGKQIGVDFMTFGSVLISAGNTQSTFT